MCIVYLYDEIGAPIGMAYRKASEANQSLAIEDQFAFYLFTKNLQGDILNIYNEAGVKVASYTYDAWGNHTVTNYTSANVGDINPFRYRGYYYDVETNFYYLNSRYYDPNVKRFINADSISYLGANGDLQAYNLYAYCSNNPVMNVDPTGCAIFTLIAILIASAIVGGVVSGVDASYNEGKSGKELVKAVAEGMIIGLLIGSAAMTTTGVAVGAIFGVKTVIFGATAAQMFAVGALGVNTVTTIIGPFYGNFDNEMIEYESAQPLVPNIKPNVPTVVW